MFVRNYSTLPKALLVALHDLAVKGLLRLEGVERNSDQFTFAVLDEAYRTTPMLLRFHMTGIVSGIIKGTHYYLVVNTGEVYHATMKRSKLPLPAAPAETVKTPSIEIQPPPVKVVEETSHPLMHAVKTKPEKNTTPNEKKYLSRDQTRLRDVDIRARVKAGDTSTAIARDYNLTPARVSQIAPVHKYGPDAI